MVNLNRPLYIEVANVEQLNQMTKEGYELICPVVRTANMHSPTYVSLNGTFMNNPINLSGNLGDGIATVSNTMYLMKLTPNASLLYGKE